MYGPTPQLRTKRADLQTAKAQNLQMENYHTLYLLNVRTVTSRHGTPKTSQAGKRPASLHLAAEINSQKVRVDARLQNK